MCLSLHAEVFGSHKSYLLILLLNPMYTPDRAVHCIVYRGGAPIGAGVMTPPTFRGKGGRGYNLGIIHISHITPYFKTLNDALIFWITTK